jgi:hypothetical protein
MKLLMASHSGASHPVDNVTEVTSQADEALRRVTVAKTPADRVAVIRAALAHLANGNAHIPAHFTTRDPLALADHLEEGANAGGARGYAAYRTARQLLANRTPDAAGRTDLIGGA